MACAPNAICQRPVAHRSGQRTAPMPLHGPKQDAQMTLKELHRLAVIKGGDAVSQLLGQAEKALALNPGDRLALMYKGAMLTMAGADLLSPARRDGYIRAGIALMQSAATEAGVYPAIAAELALLRWSTLAALPARYGQQGVCTGCASCRRQPPGLCPAGLI